MTPIPQQSLSGPPSALAVIDTNAVLDTWWFDDPRAAALARAVAFRDVLWIAAASMRAELTDVLTRRPFSGNSSQCERTLAAFDRWARVIDAAALPATLVCADPDDQCFIDLALATGARWLVTRDQALLDLAPRAARLGCLIVAPANWPVTAGPGT